MDDFLKFASASGDEWLSMLKKSIRDPFIDGVEFPRFPHSSAQIACSEVADDEAMLRAHGFWKILDAYARALGWPLSGNCQVLDIGCGWGRVTRLFAKDVHPTGIHGVDTSAAAIELCRALGVPGEFSLIEAGKPLPFPDGKFSTITAFSVLSHLPEKQATRLVAEMSRVAASGCVMAFTVEDRSFLEKLGWDNLDYHGPRLGRLAAFRDKLPALLKSFDKGEYSFLKTSEDPAAEFGEAAIPRPWMKKHWAKYIQIVEIIAAQEPVHQAVVIARKK